MPYCMKFLQITRAHLLAREAVAPGGDCHGICSCRAGLSTPEPLRPERAQGRRYLRRFRVRSWAVIDMAVDFGLLLLEKLGAALLLCESSTAPNVDCLAVRTIAFPPPTSHGSYRHLFGERGLRQVVGGKSAIAYDYAGGQGYVARPFVGYLVIRLWYSTPGDAGLLEVESSISQRAFEGITPAGCESAFEVKEYHPH